jgi:Kef-type K+ transport system membrane component KefB
MPDRLVIDLLAILAVASIVTLAVRRLRLATIPGYLIAGALIGPYALGLVHDPASVENISRLAVIFLMFGVGLSLDLNAVRGAMFHILLMGVMSTAVAALVGWPIAMAFGLSAPAALVVAIALTMSSTAVTLRILQERKELRLSHARVCVGVSVVQDLCSPAVLAVMPLLALWASAGASTATAPGPDVLRGLVVQAALALVGIVALILVARYVLPRLLAEAAHGSEEVMLVLSAAIALGAGLLTASLGLSAELGAFLGGFMLSSTPFRYQIVGLLAPTRDLFMAVFFTAVGLSVHPGVVFEGWWVIGLAVLLLIVVKGGVIAASVWTFGGTGPVALLVGGVLAQAGEFTLVLIGAARGFDLVDDRARSMLVGVVVVSLILTPMLYQIAVRMRPRVSRVPLAPWMRRFVESGEEGKGDRRTMAEMGFRRRADEAATRREDKLLEGARAIVAGFGPVGRAVADGLERRGVMVTVIELNPRTVQRQHLIGRSVVYGDASNPEVLESAGLPDVNAVVLTMPDEDAMLRACQIIRGARPDVFISARVSALSRAIQAMQLGADHTVVEELATAEAMAAQVLQKVQERAAGEDNGPKLYTQR